ncbi:MAG: hypothetical protein Q3971_02140 [Moraxella sp.]|nr:hypothetical protein [Moraxella sp.]
MADLTSDKLPLPLTQRISEQLPKDRLPFALNRKLGEVGGRLTPIIPPTPTPEPPKEKRRMSLMSGAFDGVVSAVSVVADCQRVHYVGGQLSGEYHATTDNVASVAHCGRIVLDDFEPLTGCERIQTAPSVMMGVCRHLPSDDIKPMALCATTRTTAPIHLGVCAMWHGVAVVPFYHCQTWESTAPVTHRHCVDLDTQSTHRANCQTLNVSPTVIVPCRYYPIPEPPPPPNQRACQLPPPSDRLPISLRRKNHSVQGLSSDGLPLNLTCWHDTPPAITPNRRSYIVHHTISATLDDVAIDPISFSIKTDMDSFCWQGQVQISPDDFNKIKAKLDTKRGHEPLITVNINSHPFTIIAEDISKNRSFVNHSYTLSGRSITAYLSKDYANVVKLDNDLYASQIVGEALQDLPITADFGVEDWRTRITITDTPIAIIDAVAKACGAFVTSDKADGKLYVRPRHKVPAWELATTEPDRIIPLDVIKSISEQKRTNPRYNAVILTSSTDGATVYRQHEAQDRHAPISQHELYTDGACIIPAGIAILSDSGTHQMASLNMAWVNNLPLAQLGQIWQVNDKAGNADDAWRGIVHSVAIDVWADDGVVSVWQTVGLDRYLDK